MTTGTERQKLIKKLKCAECPHSSRKAVRLSKVPCQFWGEAIESGKCKNRRKV